MKDDDKTKGQCGESLNLINKTSNRLMLGLLIIAGTVFVGLGIIGIFLPILPTTPFLLLAAACYFKGSKRMYRWLISNRWFGEYIKNYREGRGVPIKAKVFSISLLWIMIIFSAVFVVQILLVRVILLLIAVGVTIHILSIRTLKEPIFKLKFSKQREFATR